MEVESRGHRIHYEAWGHGPPLVLVIGTLQQINDWLLTGNLSTSLALDA